MHSVSARPIPEDDLLESDSSISSECELNFTQDRFGTSWRSGLVSGTSSRRVVINDTPQPLKPGDKKHRAIYSSGRNQHSPPRSILRTPSVKAKSHVTHLGSTKKEKAKQVDILRIHSNTSSSKIDFPTRKAVQNPFPVNTHYNTTVMETVPQQNDEIKLVSFLKQLLKEFQNLIECLGSTKEELSQAKIDQTSISTLHDSLSESLGNLILLVNNKILAEEEVDYPSVAETLKVIISYLIIAVQGLSEQYWKLQEEVHSVTQEKRWLQLGKESLLQEQQKLHHVLEVSKAQLLSEKNELRSKQDSVAAAKLELLKQCDTLGNRNGRQQRQRIAKLPAVSKMTYSGRPPAKDTPEMSNLREANKVAKAELAVAQDTALQLQQQMTKQYQETQKKTKDLTRTLQQAEDTMKLAAGAMGNDRRKHLGMSKPNYKRQYNGQKNKLRDIQYGKYKKLQQQHHGSKHESEQLWERASRFVQETGQGHEMLPYQSESRTVTKKSKRTTTIQSYNKPSTVSQVAKWLTHQHT